MSKDVNDDLLPRNVPKPPPLIEAVPKPSVPEVSLLFDQGKGNTVLSQPTPSRVKSSVPETVHDQSKNSPQSLPISMRSQETGVRKYIEKEDVPIINRQTESYNVWRSRNINLISGAKSGVGQAHESHIPINYNHHNKAKETSDFNVISSGSTQARDVYSGHSSDKTEVNGVIPLEYSNKGHYGFYGPKEPSGLSNLDYITLLNKYNGPPSSRDKYGDTHLPNNEHNPIYISPESNPYVSAVKQHSVTSPGNKCDVKYYRSTSADIPYEDIVQRRVSHNRSYTNVNHIPSQDTFHHNNDHMCPQNQCKSGCHDCLHNVSQKNTHCNIQPECTSPNSCHSRRQEFGHSCHRNFNHTHLCNSCPPVQNQTHINDDFHSMLTDLCSTVKLQTEQIVVLQKQVEQLLQLQIDSHKYTSCSAPVIKTSENFPNINSCSPENNVRAKQANRTLSTDKVYKNLPVIEENEQSVEKNKVSVGVVTGFQDSAGTKDTSVESHCNCSNKNKSSPKELLQKPSQERPAYYEEPPKHDENVQVKPIKPARNMKTVRKSYEKPAENKQKFKTVEESFTLNEADLAIDTIAEQAPSPASSIHVNMTEYKSNSSDSGSESDYSESSSEDEKPAEPEIGWTFYNNVVGQVNKILKRKETPPIDEDVKRATIDYLRHIGISFTDDMDNNVSKRVTFNAAGSSDRDGPSDGSVHMNGLAMQHLREDQMINGRPDKVQDFMMYNVAGGNTNLSFATLRYLERHHLLKQGQYAHYEPGGRDSRKNKSKKTKKKTYDQQQYPSSRRKSSKPSKPSSKILDVEALKQQPKLL